MKLMRLVGPSVLAMLATSGAALAQGSGGGGAVGGGVPRGAAEVNGVASSTPFVVNDDLKGRITGINAAANLLAVEDKEGKVFTFKIVAESKLKADKKSELGERKNLTLNDFQVGQPVKVVYRETDSAAMELKLLAK